MGHQQFAAQAMQALVAQLGINVSPDIMATAMSSIPEQAFVDAQVVVEKPSQASVTVGDLAAPQNVVVTASETHSVSVNCLHAVSEVISQRNKTAKAAPQKKKSSRGGCFSTKRGSTGIYGSMAFTHKVVSQDISAINKAIENLSKTVAGLKEKVGIVEKHISSCKTEYWNVFNPDSNKATMTGKTLDTVCRMFSIELNSKREDGSSLSPSSQRSGREMHVEGRFRQGFGFS